MSPADGVQVCQYHQENERILISVDTSLKNLISVIRWTIILWFPVFIASITFAVSLNHRVSKMEEAYIQLVKTRNLDHPSSRPLP